MERFGSPGSSTRKSSSVPAIQQGEQDMSECVKVIVRCRPFNDRELDANMDAVVSIDPVDRQVILRQPGINVSNPRKSFTFDSVFDTDSTNEEIYTDVVSPLVESIMMGYNGCVFAFGQTSCGKTFSMQGIPSPASQRGVMSRAFEQVFESIQTTDVTYYVVRASYLEIYNEDIRDLLNKSNHHKLELKEHPERGIYVKGLSSVEVSTVEEMEDVLEVGSWNRVLGATAQNPDSSRSHCIFTVEFEMCFTSETDGKEHFRTGRLNLVDLAGSERQRKAKAEDDRFREATKINLSLSALGNVISALVNDRSKHIPYRASKLTRLLQDSLGGNSRTLMIACVSPGENNYSETLSTLRYANRAKNIKNRPRLNEDPKDDVIRQYQTEIKMLRQLISSQMKISGEIPVLPIPGTLKSDDEGEDEESKPHVRSSVVISKHARLAYEQKITGLQHKYDHEQLTRNRLETSLASLRTEYDNYRLKTEYMLHKLRTENKLKIQQLQMQLGSDSERNESSSEESAYVSEENCSSSTSEISSRQEWDGTGLNQQIITENGPLWSYQWLKCYCDTSGKPTTRHAVSQAEDPVDESEIFPEEISSIRNDCLCHGQIEPRRGNEKSSQTCPYCSRLYKACEQEAQVVKTQPELVDSRGVKHPERETKESQSLFCGIFNVCSFSKWDICKLFSKDPNHINSP